MDELTLEERGQMIVGACLGEKSTSPYEIFRNVACRDFVRMHGPEHHVLDELMSRGLQMPGAMCGRWGVCGATASVGAALSILETTGPLTSDDSWGSHMAYTSRALEALSRIGGPRCCKRDAYISLETAVDYIRERFGIRLEKDDIHCEFHPQNAQCLGERCPFFPASRG